ncbi:20586_t:CDS:2, partial [Racocetra persica]
QQSSNKPSFNNTNDLRKSMYKEQSTSFTKRLRRVFSLSNIKQDGATQIISSTSNPSSPSPLSSPPITPKFSSLRVKGKNHIDNLDVNNKDNNIKQTTKNSNVDKDISKKDIDVATNNNNNIGSTSSSNSRRRTFMDLQSLFAKNDKKQHKEPKHQHQSSQQERQRQFRTSSSDRCPSQKKRSDDKNRNSKDGTDKERTSIEIFKK